MPRRCQASRPPDRRVIAATLVIWLLSKSSVLAMAYLATRRKEFDLCDYDITSEDGRAALLASWYVEDEKRQLAHAVLGIDVAIVCRSQASVSATQEA